MPVASKRSSTAKTPARKAAKPATAESADKADKTERAPSTSRIMDAAVHLFATRGYANSTLEEVAAMAGFTKGAVYYYFKSKERLLLDVLSTIEARSIDATAAAIRSQGGTPSEQLDEFVRLQTRWAARYPEDLAILMLMSIETARTKSKARTLMLRMYGKLGGVLETIIEAGKKSGEFSAEQDTRDTVLYLQAVHDGNMMIWYRSGTDPETGRKLTRATLSGFAHAVRRNA
ncbi:MAG: TetR/AcrR family transcriptional regulator [Variovorax sp.]|nr:MAG: TetR/AcrR family transcriptional regulator [Variovorax sp.]